MHNADTPCHNPRLLPRLRAAAAASLIAVASVGGSAGVESTVDEPDAMVEFSLVASAETVAPGGTTLVGLRFEIVDGWHVYWKGYNDTGFPISPTWELPEGWTAGELLWPAPHRYIAPGEILDYVYEDEVMLFLPIQAPADASPGDTLELEIAADWLVCREACIPEDGSATITLTVATDAPKLDRDFAAGSWSSLPKPMAHAATRLPRPIKDALDIEPPAWDEGRLVIKAKETADWLAFYPADTSMNIVNPIKTGKTKAGVLRLQADTGSPAETARLTGIVEVYRGEDKAASLYWIDEPLPSEAE